MDLTVSPAEAGTSPEASAPQTITVRALLAGAVCVAATCVLVTWAELVVSTIRIGYMQLPPVSIAMLFSVLALTRGLTRFLKRWAFSPSELALVYIMSLVAAMVSSHGMAQKLLPLLVAPNYFATFDNGWQTLFGAHLPAWLAPYHPHGAPRQNVARWYYEGLPRGGVIPWRAWVIPLLVWGLFFGLIFFAFLCLTTLLRRQWMDNEKLSFPLAKLPLEILQPGGRPFFSNPGLWLGAAIPIVIYSVNWLHQLAPSLPLVTTSLNLNDYLTAPPWDQMAYTPLICSFAALGFFYLLPMDILFSLWFFFLLTRLEQVVGIGMNMDMPHMPTSWLPVFEGYQIIGAYFVLVASFLMTARPHLRRLWGSVSGHERISDSVPEMLPIRVAFWGLWLSLAAACLLTTAMGMSLWLSVFELLCIVLVIGLVMARSTAEAGLLMTETTFQPYDVYRIFGSLHGLGPANLTLLAFVDHLFSHDQRGLLLTGMLDSAYLGDRVRLRRGSVGLCLALGIVCAVVIAIPLQLILTYKIGALKMDSWMMQGSPLMQFRVNASLLQGSQEATSGSWQMPVFFAVGALVTVFLIAMRSCFVWWPLHPLGYALAGSQSTIEFWFPCLMAWGLKGLTLRYGGISRFRAWRPFFLGLILGEFGMAVLSALASVLFRVPPPPFPWI